MREIKTKLYSVEGKGLYIYLPLELVRDSAFPFSTGEVVTVRIAKDKLVIE